MIPTQQEQRHVGFNLKAIDEIVNTLRWTSFDRMALDELAAATNACIANEPETAAYHLKRYTERFYPLTSESVRPHLYGIENRLGVVREP